MTTALLLSGGLDSTALAWWRRPDIAVTIDYGQRPAEAEIRAAAAVADTIGCEHVVHRVDLSALGSGDMNGRPGLSIAPVPEWWPYRNQMLITLGAMAVIARGASEIMMGTLASDRSHADGSPEFVAAMDALLRTQEGAMRVIAPAMEMEAEELIRTSGVPLDVLAWAHSCHRANEACGMCRGCDKHYRTMGGLGEPAY